ncbi:MAG: nickel-dependent hydrogenase large subunit [Pseudomonadota bacterium]
MSKTISIRVPAITRVEGEGALDLDIVAGNIETLRLRIYEPPRVFEKFLQGRDSQQVLDMVARICGICPVAYQMSAAQAIENCFGVKLSPWAKAMRRLLYCGEWIESHSLHMHLLALPDFFGYDSAIEMAKIYPQEVTRGMQLQALGNDIVALLGKRSVHPVGVAIGGFHHAPTLDNVNTLRQRLEGGLEQAEALLNWLPEINLPEDHQVLNCVAISQAEGYAMIDGDIVSSQGLNLPQAQFYEHFKEEQVPYSTAKHCLLDGKPYLVGPLARLHLNYDDLPQPVKDVWQKVGIDLSTDNMFHSIYARAIEMYFALYEAHRILSAYEYTEHPAEKFVPKAGVGYGCTEAPRGMLWHRYEMAADGTVIEADIVPPTSQNQAQIEANLYSALQKFGLDREENDIRLHSEMVIRNYDPCISCSTHFLNVNMKRR